MFCDFFSGALNAVAGVLALVIALLFKLPAAWRENKAFRRRLMKEKVKEVAAMIYKVVSLSQVL